MSKPTPSAPQSGTPDQPAAGKGEPSKIPQAQGPQVQKQQTLKDESIKSSLELPHERDQAKDMTHRLPDPKLEQAASDVAKGLKDTSKALETDQAYKKL